MDLKLEEKRGEVLEMLKQDSGIKARQISRQIESIDINKLKSKREILRFEHLLDRVKKYYSPEEYMEASFLGPVLF